MGYVDPEMHMGKSWGGSSLKTSCLWKHLEGHIAGKL